MPPFSAFYFVSPSLNSLIHSLFSPLLHPLLSYPLLYPSFFLHTLSSHLFFSYSPVPSLPSLFLFSFPPFLPASSLPSTYSPFNLFSFSLTPSPFLPSFHPSSFLPPSVPLSLYLSSLPCFLPSFPFSPLSPSLFFFPFFPPSTLSLTLSISHSLFTFPRFPSSSSLESTLESSPDLLRYKYMYISKVTLHYYIVCEF